MYKFALIQSDNAVQALVQGTARYKHAQYTAVQVKPGVTCKEGMFYNEKTGLFYDDAAFTKIGDKAVATATEAESA